jgi:4a-hydroxytetrahydrobiopterin dehydratase
MTALAAAEISKRLKALDGWACADNAIVKTYRFPDYHQTMAFVNATAWISHREDHHPDLAVGFNQCAVTYTTHSAGGLTAHDFACAAKIDALFAL